MSESWSMGREHHSGTWYWTERKKEGGTVGIEGRGTVRIGGKGLRGKRL